MDKMFLTVHCGDVEEAPQNDSKYVGANAWSHKTKPEGAEEYVAV